MRHFYDELRSILVYPTPFVVRETHHDEDGVVSEGEDVLSGQAWDASGSSFHGRTSKRRPQATTSSCTNSPTTSISRTRRWMALLALAARRSMRSGRASSRTSSIASSDDIDAGRETLLDPYAATEPAEFFAVATEAFFEQASRAAISEHAGLYEQTASLLSPRSRGGTLMDSTSLRGDMRYRARHRPTGSCIDRGRPSPQTT